MPRACVILMLGVFALAAARADADPLLAKKRRIAVSKPRTSTAALDCAQARELACGASADSTNAGAENHVSAYACADFDESGGEVVYRFVLDGPTQVDLRLEGMSGDLDLFVLTGCQADDCIAASAGVSSEEIHRCLTPGTYYAVVEGFSGEESAFHLALQCSPCTPCTPRADNDSCERALEIPASVLPFHVFGSTRCASDDYTDGTCTGYSSAGRDVAYRIAMAPGCSVRITLRDGPDGIPLDRSVYLASSCADARGTCVAGSDASAEGDESFTYQSAEGGIFYLVIDSFGLDTGGDYELLVEQTNCASVGVAARTWQQMKSIYK